MLQRYKKRSETRESFAYFFKGVTGVRELQEFRHFPPNGWNCQCNVVQVLKGKYPTTPDNEVEHLTRQNDSDNPKEQFFRFNPGLERKTFPDYNPYTIRRCRDCDIAKGNLKLARTSIPDYEICASCRILRQCMEQPVFSKIDNKEGFDRLKAVAKEVMKEYGTIREDDRRFYTGHLFLGRMGRRELLRHTWTSDECQALCKISKWFPNIKDGKYLHIDMSRANWKKKMEIDHIRHFVVYNITIDGTEFIFKTAAVAKNTHSHGRVIVESPYSLKRKERLK
ncbi:MAG: hypothetical protein IJ605_00075 [Prevotella sp.]|nr:hypothetical protein [Prevotella sp.]